jgi:hypothetical protein
VTSQLPYDLVISVIAVVAVCFILIGIFYPAIANRLGLEEGSSGQRLLSAVLGLMLFALLLIYRLARESMMAV